MKCACGFDHATVMFEKDGKRVCTACAVAALGGYTVIRDPTAYASPYPPKKVKSLPEKKEAVRRIFESRYVAKKLGEKYILSNGDSAALGAILDAAGGNVSEAERIVANAFRDDFAVKQRVISLTYIARWINKFMAAKTANRTDAAYKK